MSDTALISVTNCHKTFPHPEGKTEFTVLDSIDLTIEPGEVVALLGRSGSGKSTLLRIMAGLIPATSGSVRGDGVALHGPNPGVAMVFQSFALLPWLTVLENVELGLEARGMSRVERTKRALKAIDLVGLDGFESAYPKELSGGMKQRVGFARALVVEPKVLFLDEPFSALDVLTAENLRGEIDDLWNAGTFPAQSIVLVTHNIEEGVFLADRVIVLGANPGRVRGEVRVDLPRPHNRSDERFKRIVDYLYQVMTNPTMEIGPMIGSSPEAASNGRRTSSPYAHALPHVRVGSISGLLELIYEQAEAREELAEIAERLMLPIDDLLPIIDAAVMLKFATIEDGAVRLTDVGRAFATTTILRSKELFRRQVLEYAPIVATITNTLKQKETGKMGSDFFLDLLDEHVPADEARRQFDTAVEWGRYAELYEYDATDEELTLSDGATAPIAELA